MSAKPKPLAENDSVKELIAIFRENNMRQEAGGLADVMGNIAALEHEIVKTLLEVTAMRHELSAMREERNHPVKTMLQKAVDGLITKLKAIQSKLTTLKDKLIGACKGMVEAFKAEGVSALNNVVETLDIKRGLEEVRNDVNSAIDHNQKQIAKIEATSTEMHAAGRHIKNITLAIQGKEPIPDIKPNGKLAHLIETPFRLQVRRLNRSLGFVNKALAQLYKLEKAAEKRAEQDRPSTLETIKETKDIVEKKKDAPVKDKTKTAAVEI